MLSQILASLALDFEPEMFDFYKNNQIKQLEPKETVAWKQKTLQPIDAKDIGIYKRKLTKKEIAQFNLTAKDALKLFDYDVEC
ncbi:hypothetical protein [Bizionia psychrotolerans]|uniref:hypothetical protein n=1 Tax=Bizionia psychrotolerans TaxID=1492901 RepID=UPI000650734F|nr:hypothetical protein [Bizionia psychrotolerans]